MSEKISDLGNTAFQTNFADVSFWTKVVEGLGTI